MREKTAMAVGVVLLAALLVLLSGQALIPEPRRTANSNQKQAARKAQTDRFWVRAVKEVYLSPGELKAQDDKEKRKGEYYAKLMHGSLSDKEIALTFDDGPHPKYTRELLGILRKYNVKATFFVVGFMAEKYPMLVNMEYAQGHLVANHTYHHVNLIKIPDKQVPVEWQACSDVIKSIIGRSPKFARPPGGDYDSAVIRAAMSRGLTTVLWTDDPGDYARPGDKVIKSRVLDRIGNGGIILLHDGIQQTMDVLPQLIETLQRKGFKFVMVDQMMRDLQSARAK